MVARRRVFVTLFSPDLVQVAIASVSIAFRGIGGGLGCAVRRATLYFFGYSDIGKLLESAGWLRHRRFR
jgi:hypothetical protein